MKEGRASDPSNPSVPGGCWCQTKKPQALSAAASRVFQPQPEPSGAEFQLFQLESWQGWLCILPKVRTAPCKDPCTQQSRWLQK
ncbi:hypothetical protein Nmel_015297 [Mimus melanotis]